MDQSWVDQCDGSALQVDWSWVGNWVASQQGGFVAVGQQINKGGVKQKRENEGVWGERGQWEEWLKEKEIKEKIKKKIYLNNWTSVNTT